ncbi:MAG TPA: helix-turn-helix domain-containing protein [Chromatiaceae bacterium]|nr:helix-turn-helix domain-containing protein [Chromatiaceae bacterium]
MTDLTRYRLAGPKQIPACKAGGTWRFSRADLDAWIRPQGAEGQGGNGPTSTPDRRG